MSYSKSDTLFDPPQVTTGLMDRTEFRELETYAETDEKAYKEMLIGLSCRSNLLFGSFFLDNFDIPPFMVEVEEQIARAQERNHPTNVCIPRGHIKSSSRVICDSIRLICLSSVPSLPEMADPRIALFQESKPTAIKTTLAIKNDLEYNKRIRYVFGDLQRNSIEWGKDTIWIRNNGVGASKEATFTANGIFGGTGFHSHFYKLDDVTTYNQGRTKGRKQNALQWYETTIRPAKEPQTQEEVVYTPYFDGEMTHVFEKDASRVTIRKPALNRMVKSNDFEIVMVENQRVGVKITDSGMDLRALWPCPLGTGNCPNTEDHYREYGLHRSVEWLINEQYLGNPFKFNTQFMLLRASELDTRIKPDMLRFWTRNRANAGIMSKYTPLEAEEGGAARYIEYPGGFAGQVSKAAHTWDTALGKTKAHDRSVGAIGYRLKNNDMVVLFQKGRWDPVRVLQIMTTTAANDPIADVKRPVVENANFEKVLGAVANDMQGIGKLISTGIKIVERERTNSDKDLALSESGILAHMMAGKVFVEVEDEDAIEELLAFRQDLGHEHDDVVDAIRMCYTELFAADKRHKIGLV